MDGALDYVSHEIKEKKHKINPNTKNIIEEIDSIFLNEMKPNYVDEVELERKIKHAFKNHNRFEPSRKMLRIGKSHHGHSCEMNEGEYDYLLNLEYLEAVKELDGIARIVTCDQKNYLVFRGTSLRSFLGNRWDPHEEYRYSHVHYYFMEIKMENLNDIEGITKKLEKSLHGVVAKRFPIEDCIRDQLEVEEEMALNERYVRHYELVKEARSQLGDMNMEPPQIEPIPKYGGLILTTLSISCKPNIPLTKEDIQSYLEKIEIETLLNLGDFEIRKALYSFKNAGFSFEDLYKILSQQYSEGKRLKERLRLLSSKLTELIPTGYISENTRPLQLKTILNEKKCICEGYVIILGLLFHFWQDIFPELLNNDVYFCLFQNETLNDVVKGAKFREPHMIVVVRIDNRLEVVDPTNRISDETIRRNKGLEELLQGEGYKKIYKIRKIEEIRHD